LHIGTKKYGGIRGGEVVVRFVLASAEDRRHDHDQVCLADSLINEALLVMSRYMPALQSDSTVHYLLMRGLQAWRLAPDRPADDTDVISYPLLWVGGQM
jgi:hypothetical protein